MRILSCLLLCVACVAEEPRSLDEVLEPIREKRKLPALSAVLVKADGTVVAAGAVGTRRAGGEDRVTTGDLWHLGSCTKAMTATLCARLVEKGTLKWTTTLGETFPELKEEMDEGWRGVTLEQLLCNRGGAPTGLDRDGLWGEIWKHPGTTTEGRRLLLKGLIQHPPEYEPGTKYVYANAGFALAGHMAETKAKEPWEELIRREVFTPLGITTAGFGAPGKAGDKADQPRGHRGDKPVEPGPGADNPATIGPAGTVHMSLPDWGRFVAAHLRRPADFLKEETWTKLHTAPGDNYAMGWLVAERPAWAKGEGKDDKGRVLTHSGSNTMWFCVAWLAPEKGFAVLVATNAAGEGAGKGTDEAAGAVIGEWKSRK